MMAKSTCPGAQRTRSVAWQIIFKSFGWEAGQAAVFPALVNGTDYRGALFTGTKSFYPLSELRERGVIPYGESPGNLPRLH